jgi:hypothetical protein
MCRLYSLSDEAIRHVKMRDRRSCTAFVQHAIKSRRMSTSMLSPDVINKFAKDVVVYCKQCYIAMQDIKTYHIHYGGKHWPAKRSRQVKYSGQ